MLYNGTIQLFPLLRVALALVAGCAVALLCPSVPLLAWLLGAVAALMLAIILHRHDMAQTTALLLLFFMVGALRMSQKWQEVSVPLPAEEQVYQAVVTSEPQERGKVVRMDLMVVGGPLHGHRLKAALLRDTLNQRYSHLHLGDGIVARSLLQQPDTMPQSQFNYPLYLKSRDFIATTFIYYRNWRKAVVPLTDISYMERTRLAALQLRQNILKQYFSWQMDDDPSAITIAMTMGDRSRITQEMREVYSISGASHVLALSGLHLGIIYAMLVILFGYRRFRALTELLIIIGIWTYAFLTGLSPSVQRAAFMISIYSIVSLIQRDRMSLNTLSLTAIIMLLIHPLSLVDVGFQMSFMAVLFIIVFSPRMFAWVPERWLDTLSIFSFHPLRWLWAMVVVSCCAQLGTAPLTAFYFGRFSTYFLASNCVVMPLTTLILYVTLLVFAFSFCTPVQQWLIEALNTKVQTQNQALAAISQWPGSHVSGLSPSALLVLGFYLLVFIMLLTPWRRVGRFLFNRNSPKP